MRTLFAVLCALYGYRHADVFRAVNYAPRYGNNVVNERYRKYEHVAKRVGEFFCVPPDLLFEDVVYRREGDELIITLKRKD